MKEAIYQLIKEDVNTSELLSFLLENFEAINEVSDEQLAKLFYGRAKQDRDAWNKYIDARQNEMAVNSSKNWRKRQAAHKASNQAEEDSMVYNHKFEKAVQHIMDFAKKHNLKVDFDSSKFAESVKKLIGSEGDKIKYIEPSDKGTPTHMSDIVINGKKFDDPNETKEVPADYPSEVDKISKDSGLPKYTSPLTKSMDDFIENRKKKEEEYKKRIDSYKVPKDN